MNRLRLVYLIFIISMLSVVATSLFYSFFIIDSVIEKEMKLIIGDHPGFDAGTDTITFGMITKDGSCRRDITLSNKKNYIINVKIQKSGNISSFVLISDDDFVLNPGEEKKVYFTASSTPETEYGEYTGTAIFILKRML
ncbi:MAG: hypothetical protein PHV16_02825 [Candidatus Nanoarchaeia archaeon]|nr:hypothetical protein [Candidatus Nanoarchaeia archaeon]